MNAILVIFISLFWVILLLYGFKLSKYKKLLNLVKENLDTFYEEKHIEKAKMELDTWSLGYYTGKKHAKEIINSLL